MQTYETLIITKPTLEKDAYATLLKKIQTSIGKNLGTDLKTNEWGVKRLSYEIKKCREGTYTLFEFGGVTDTVKRVHEYLKLQTDVLRFVTTLKPRPPKVVAPAAGAVPTAPEAPVEVPRDGKA